MKVIALSHFFDERQQNPTCLGIQTFTYEEVKKTWLKIN